MLYVGLGLTLKNIALNLFNKLAGLCHVDCPFEYKVVFDNIAECHSSVLLLVTFVKIPKF